jgi:DNA-binding NarL/FixJ family response regulator
MGLNGHVASQTARVLVVDDHSAVRSGIEALLAGEPDLEPVGTAGGAAEALELARQTRPDVAIVDFQLGDRDGLSLCRQLKELPDPTRVVLYSAYADGPLALAGVIAGADGVVHKAALAGELCDTVRAVAAGRTAIPVPPPAARAVVAARLDPDDLPILAMLLDGTDPDEIARVLGMRPGWLAARRWAMLERLRRLPTRRGAPPANGDSDWPADAPRP